MSAWLDFLRGNTASGDNTFRFAFPAALLALALMPILWWWKSARSRRRVATLRFASVALLRRAGGSDGRAWRRILDAARFVALALFVVALARPQYGRISRQTYSEGIDIALVLDVSNSMQARDLQPTRLEAAKAVLADFVSGRVGDRLALIIFATEAAPIVPLTLDYGVVQAFIERITFNLVPGDTTAIGMGLATAIKKLTDGGASRSVAEQRDQRSTDDQKPAEHGAKSKVVILLTDGVNNAGKIDPLTAAEAAKASKIKVYTIGVGLDQNPNGSVFSRNDGGVDEELLTKIADMTGGKFYRATDTETLGSVYKEIDRLEKSKVESLQFDNFNDLAPWLIFPALALLLVELTGRSTRFVRVP